MSHYYCSEHTDNADSRCITCEAAREWVEKDSTISTLQARINALTAEVEEQARLLGTSGSREAELLARIEALEDFNYRRRKAYRDRVIDALHNIDTEESPELEDALNLAHNAIYNAVTAALLEGGGWGQ